MASSRNDPTTSEMRHDWLTDRWVIVAPQRTARPIEFIHSPARTVPGENCPFCFGHEDQTPESVACYYEHCQGSGVGQWRVRVVPNKFPAVQGGSENGSLSGAHSVSAGLNREVDEATRAMWDSATNKDDSRAEQANTWAVEANSLEVEAPAETTGLFRRRSLSGGHEVIIEGPGHHYSLSQLDRLTAKLVFQAYRDRLRYWLVEQRIAYAVLFKNVGYQAGASLVHSHSQLIATDILPTDVARAASRMELFYAQQNQCLLCRTLHEELDQQVRIVEATSDFVAYCPFASRLPSLVTIVPQQHQSQFELLSDPMVDQLSWLLHRLVRRLEHCHPNASYNYVVYTAPRCQQGADWFHWRIELFPRLSTLAGFEWGSECFINPQTPEAAAKLMRLAGV